jgi:hypothetical protein
MSEVGKGVPVEPIAQGNYDRAWNDPPLFSYDESTNQQHQQTGLKLNKRIGFPSAPPTTATPTTGTEEAGHLPRLHDAGARPPPDSLLPPPPSILPPPPSSSLPPPPSALSVDTSESKPETVLGKDEVCRIMRSLVEENCGVKSGDISKRLDLLEKSWTSANFNPRVGLILSKFVQSLQRDEYEGADRSLTTLGADHSGDCAQWIIALRHLLTSMRAQTTTVQTAPVQISTPFFNPTAQTM